MSFLFQKLEVYRKAVVFAGETGRISQSLTGQNRYLNDQLNRASLSIAANLAEGNGRWHPKDRRRFFSIARGSLQECVAILDICKTNGLVEAGKYDELMGLTEVIAKMLSGLIKKTAKDT